MKLDVETEDERIIQTAQTGRSLFKPACLHIELLLNLSKVKVSRMLLKC